MITRSWRRLASWWSGAIANRVAAAAAGLIALLVLLLTTLAYANARALLLSQSEERLSGYAELLGGRMALMLAEFDIETRALAGNSLVTNAMLDSSGRAAYLEPFLRDQRLRGQTERTFTLVDHTGRTLATNAIGRAPHYGGAAWLQPLIAEGRPAASWADATRTRLLLAHPVRLPATAQPEGAMVLEVPLAPTFAGAASVLPPNVRARLLEADRTLALAGSAMAEGEIPQAASRPLDATAGASRLELSVEAALPRAAALEGLDNMARRIVIVGIAALLLAAAVAHWTVRRLLAPLMAIGAVARRIRDERRIDQELPGQGNDEIGTVAQSFNAMLATVRDSQALLEDQVAARTAALEGTRARLDAIQREMNDGLLVIDDAGCIETFSGACERLFGVAAADVLGQGIARLIPRWSRLRTEAADEIGSTGRFQRLSSGRRGPTEFPAIVSASLMHHGGKARWVVLVRDDTANQEAQARMVESHRLLESSVNQLSRRDEDMARINALNELLAACGASDEAHVVIEHSLSALFAGHGGALAVLRSAGQLEVVAQWGERSPSLPQFSVADCWALRLGRPHDAGDSATPGCRHCSAGAGAGICLPLSVQGETLGVLMSHAGQNAGADERRRMAALLGTVGEAVKFGLANVKLREALHNAALRDALTGLFNRRYFDETAPRELQRMRRSRQPLALAMLDLDHFKRFNDEHGHEAGDLVLQATARALADGLRSTDIVCRLGGEELVALLPEADARQASMRLDEVRLELAALRIEHRGRVLPAVTVSIGIAQYQADGTTVDALLRSADDALYRAKANGRDCTAFAAAAEALAPA